MADENDGGFIRQRRNLMIISLVLLFSEVAELKLEKLSVFGTDLKIGEPQVVNLALWIAGLYWLWRYYQYSRPIFRRAIEGAIYQRTQETSLPAALQKVLRENPSYSERFPDVPADPTFSITNFVYWGQTADQLNVEITVHKQAVTSHLSASHEYGAQRVRLSAPELRPLRRRAWFHLIVHTTVFTDLVLPYVLFGLPLFYTVYRIIKSCF